MELLTQLGHPIGVSVSAMQKAIRRGDAKLACHFAIDLARSNYWRYLWERVLIISAEDISTSESITQEIVALANSYASTVRHLCRESSASYVSRSQMPRPLRSLFCGT
jgi:replication-associated recombination protein RarA